MSTMSLPVKLTKTERLALADEQSVELTALEGVEAEKKAANSGYNASIKRHKLSMHERNKAISTGIVDREVEVRELLDTEKGRVRVIRLDTFETVSDRPMDDDERQLRLEGTGPTITDKTADEQREQADEQRDAKTPEEAERLRDERLSVELSDRIMGQVAGLMLMAKLDDGAEGGPVTLRVEHGDIVAEATAETETAARVELARYLVEIVTSLETKKAAAAATPPAPETTEPAPGPEYSAAVIARADAHLVEATVELFEQTGMFVAKLSTPISVMEAEGTTEELAREALRAKLLAKYHAEEQKLLGGGGLKNGGLKPPAGAKGKTGTPPAPSERDACDGPGCTKPHVHDAPPSSDDEMPF